ARAAWHQHGAEGARAPRQDDLVGHTLIGAQWSFGGEQIRSDVPVLVRGVGDIPCVGLIEYPHREQPEHSSSQGYDDAVTPTFDGTPSQRLNNTDSAEPTHHVVAYRNDRRRLGLSRCS